MSLSWFQSKKLERAKCDCGMFGPAHYDDCALVRDLRWGEAVLQVPRGGLGMFMDHEGYQPGDVVPVGKHDRWLEAGGEGKLCVFCGDREVPAVVFSDKRGLYLCEKHYRENPRAKTTSPNPKDLIGVKKVPTLSVIPSAGLVHCGRAMANGSEKYGRMNWREHPVKASIYLDAALRHLMGWTDGEENAADSGVHHLGHVMACCAILLDAQEAGNMIDDRVPGPAADLLERFKED